MNTGVIKSYWLDKTIEFPLRVCDLTPNTHLGFTLYDLSQPIGKSLIGSTMLDVFDCKSLMR